MPFLVVLHLQGDTMALTITRKGYSIIDKKTLKLIFTGKIRDSLHDTIPFTDGEKKVINSKEFQKLRRISQTAFTLYAFPGATHTRFEHSLGVMHVADLMLNSIINNQKRLLESLDLTCEDTPKHSIEFFLENEKINGSLSMTKNALHYLENCPYITQCLRFAALLHDIGHAPYSHSGERFMVTWKNFEENLPHLDAPEWLKSAFKNKIIKLESNKFNLNELKIRHEVYTLIIIAKMFKYEDEFLSEKMGQDICAILDLSVSPNLNGELFKSGLQNLLHEIVSGEIDADRMDYLLRDSRECGIIYGYFDLGRILDSLGFYLNHQTNKYHLALRRSGISAFEDYLRARWSMYQQVYFHKTVTACEAMLQNINKLFPQFSFPLNTEEYLKIDEHSFYQYIEKNFSENLTIYTKEILNDLIFNRKLWKRVYEEFIPKNTLRTIPSLCPAITSYLQKLECPTEIIENSTNLTNFSPKGKDSSSKNNLKIIIKDVHSLRYLEPVENHSTLINRVDEEFIIRRIYIARYKENLEDISSKEIQKIISDKIINPDNA